MKKSLWSSKRSDPISLDTDPNAGYALVDLSADMVQGLCTDQDGRGWTPMPVHHSCHSEKVLLGSYDTWVISSSRHSKVTENHSLKQETETMSFSFYLITAIAPWDPSCSCSTTTQGFTPHGKITLPGFWQCSFPQEQSPPGDALQSSTPPAQGESLWVGSGLQQKLCSRRHVCEPII